MGRRGRTIFFGIVAALATILGSHAALGQSSGSVPDGAGLRDTLTGARHPGLRGWRVTTIQGGDSIMQRNTLLPPAQIACGFSSAKMTSRGAQEQACARETSPQTLAEATVADGRMGGLCVAPRPMQGGYALRYNAQFPGAGSDTVVTCIVVANGVQLTQFGLAQHERDVRAFLTGVTIPGEAPAPPPVVASRPGATASGAPAAANSDAGRLAELALTFGAKGPLRQLTLQAARAHLPMVNWTKASAASEDMGEYMPARVEGLLSGLNTTIEGDMVWFYADYGGKKLPPKAALLTSLVGQGATVRRHGCLQESNGAGRSFYMYRHEAVAVTPPTGRPFLAFVGTTQHGQNAEEVSELRIMLKTPFPPMRDLFFGNGDPPTRPCPAWAPVTAVAP